MLTADKIRKIEVFNEYANSLPQLSNLYNTDFRICTYNIHYFTDTMENNSYEQIFKDIYNIRADIIILQEVIIGSKAKIRNGTVIDCTNVIEDFKKIGYSKNIFCNTVPSWYSAVYGNILLVHDSIVRGCIPKCLFLNENIHSFPLSKKAGIVSGTTMGNPETRCYIYTSIGVLKKTLHCYFTHLDVEDEGERLEQIKKIIFDASKHPPNDYVFIMGDFNTIDRDQYEGRSEILDNKYQKNNGDVISTLKKEGYNDLALSSPQNSLNKAAEMTTWSGVRVDFIFCNKIINPNNYTLEYYSTTASDHLPVVLTLKQLDNR